MLGKQSRPLISVDVHSQALCTSVNGGDVAICAVDRGLASIPSSGKTTAGVQGIDVTNGKSLWQDSSFSSSQGHPVIDIEVGNSVFASDGSTYTG